MGEIADARVRLPQLTRRLINLMVTDVLNETARRLAQNGIAALADVYQARAVLVDFSDELKPRNDALGAFLYENFYFDYRVKRGTTKGQMIVARLFGHFKDHPRLLPPVEQADYNQAQKQGGDRLGREPLRVIVDFIAGMTDREAYNLYVRLFEVGHG
jgi:dGTPase